MRKLLALLLVVLAVFTGCGKAEESSFDDSSSPEIVSYENAYMHDAVTLKGVLAKDIDFNVATVKLTDVSDNFDKAKAGDTVKCKIMPYADDDKDKISLLDIEYVYIKGRGVTLQYLPEQVKYSNKKGTLYIKPSDNCDRLTLQPDDPEEQPVIDDKFTKRYYTKDGSSVMLTEKQYKKMKEQKKLKRQKLKS